MASSVKIPALGFQPPFPLKAPPQYKTTQEQTHSHLEELSWGKEQSSSSRHGGTVLKSQYWKGG